MTSKFNPDGQPGPDEAFYVELSKRPFAEEAQELIDQALKYVDSLEQKQEDRSPTK